MLALHKACASLEGMLGARRGFQWVVTAKTGAARRRALSLGGLLHWCGRWRSKVFVRECLVGAYLLFTGAWLSARLRERDLFWFYGIYLWAQARLTATSLPLPARAA